MTEQYNRTVLIIDDDPAIRQVVRIQLRNTGIRLLEAEDTTDVMEVLSDHPVSAIICDIKLHKLSGFEVFREIRKYYPEMPVIMLTGYIEQEYYDTSLNMGALDLIIKPVRKEQLLQTLQKAFEAGS